MQEIRFKDQVYSIPTSWDEVTIAQQIEADTLANEYPNLKGLIERSAYTGIPFQLIREASATDPELINLFKVTSFIEKQGLPIEPVHEFIHNGHTYSVLDSLLEAQAQDFISTQAIVNESKNNGSAWQSMPQLIAIIAKRPGETLDDYKIDVRAKEFETLSLSIANRLYVFFCLIANAFTTNSHQTLIEQNQVITMLIKNLKDTAKQRDGMGWSGRLRMKILLKYLLYLERGWKTFYSGFKSEVSK